MLNLYGKRDVIRLREAYLKHVTGMTEEGLHKKIRYSGRTRLSRY